MRSCVVIFFLSLLTAGLAHALKNDELVLFTENFSPYNFLENDKIVGINTDLVKKMCELANIKCIHKMLPWSRAYSMALKTKNAGLYSTSRNSTRENDFKWVGPLSTGKGYFFKLKSRTEITGHSINELSKYKIVVSRNGIYEEVLAERGFIIDKTLLYVTNKEHGYHLFFQGKVDLVIANPNTLAGSCNRSNIA